MLVGVILIGAAAMLAATSAEGTSLPSLPALSTGFLVWSLSGAFGLLAGMIASHHGRRSATRAASAHPALPVGYTETAAADGFHAALETVEESA